MRGTIFDVVVAAGLDSDCPYVAADADASESLPRMTPELADSLSQDAFDAYVSELYTYIGVLENRLFSEGLHALGKPPTERSMAQYLNAYFDGDVS